MAHSHNQVGISFGKLKDCTGSRMYSSSATTISPHADDMAICTNKLFYTAQNGVSYRTVVARIMRNAHTKTTELWVTPRHYSSSTERHKGYFTSGFRKSHGLPDDSNVYVTPVIEMGMYRHDPAIVRNVIGVINQDLREVDKPRLREATRRGTIDSCLFKAKRAMHNFTHNVPLDMVDADAFYDLHATLDFLVTTQAIADIDEVRAAVKGYLALLETSQ